MPTNKRLSGRFFVLPINGEGFDVTGKAREPMGADLLRQRRNLLVISLALVAVQLAGATFEGKVSIFGAGITFDHPERLLLGAWVLWGYFLLRYWQYLKQEGGLGIHAAMDRRIFKWCEVDTHDGEYLFYIWWRGLLSWELCSHRTDEAEERMSRSLRDPESGWLKRCMAVRAFVFVALNTDYLLPFAVAALPVSLTVVNFTLKP